MTVYPRPMQTGWTRFRHGAFECTVVTDGLLHMGAPHATFPGAPATEIDALLTRDFLPTDTMTLDQNILIVDTGDNLVQFDTGVGVDAELGVRTFGPRTGQAIPNMRAAGIDPADIDVVALTHAHPDHCWGLVDDAGEPLYPNATVAVSRADLDYWTDLSILDTPRGQAMNAHMRDHFIGAHKNLTPYIERGRIAVMADGAGLVPGIVARGAGGHSPGHLMYEVASEGETLLVWGDLLHHQVLLLRHPDWTFVFDHDGERAVKTRLRVLADVVRDRPSVLSYHFPFPGRGHVVEDDGRYRWVPMRIEFA